MIYIDFIAGSHGNFLEFVCNKFLANVPGPDTPFNSMGASHKKNYRGQTTFVSNHFFQKDIEIKKSKVISIQITTDDLLPLASISLLRAGDLDIDNDTLEINTYNKFNNPNYAWVLENLIQNFFDNQIQNSYNVVKDPSWPEIFTLDQYRALPQWIQDECSNQHNLELLELFEHQPNCPRYILREFFKLGFKYPAQSGFMTEQNRMQYDSSNQVHVFPYSCFYDTKNFLHEIEKLSKWTEFKLSSIDQLQDLHVQFLSKQPYKNSKKFCDGLLKRLESKEIFDLPKLDLFQESYVSAKLELALNKELPLKTWFVNSAEIYELEKITS